MTNLASRVLVATIGIPVILVAAYAGGFIFAGFIALVSTLALLEFYKLARVKGVEPQVGNGVVFGLFLITAFMHGRCQYLIMNLLAGVGIAAPFPTMTQSLLILMLLFFPFTIIFEVLRKKSTPLLNIAATMFGVLYVSFFLGSLVGLRELFAPGDFPVYRHFDVVGVNVPEDVVAMIDGWGGRTVIAVFVSIWMCDSTAYFAGRAMGKHKLLERISPHKTIEGAVAGLLAAVAVFLAAKALVLPFLGWFDALVCGLIVGVFGQLGDLAESMLKRDAGVKDSSALIPGHGGVLDRFDSLIVVSPLMFLYIDFIVF